MPSARCVASATNERARSYQQDQSGGDTITMNIVVQAMVDARAAGVVFTADPVSARRDLLVIDAVAGLGEALVSGEATPDHYGVHSSGAIVRRQLTGTSRTAQRYRDYGDRHAGPRCGDA